MKYAASFIGWSNTGKTGLITTLIRKFSDQGFHVSALKSSHVQADFDVPGKDTERFFQGGAEQVGYFSSRGGFIRFRATPSLEMIEELFDGCDILLAEGLSLPGFPCLEVVSSRNLQEGYKCEAGEVSAYVTAEPGHYADRPALDQPILTASHPEAIMFFLEEQWKAK